MDKFDVIVIGAGAGENVVSDALAEGLKVALVEKGLLGGTCLNNGCIPSKMLIYPADVIRAAQEAKAVGVMATAKPDFRFIMDRMRTFIRGEEQESEEQLSKVKNLTMFRDTASFAGDHTLEVGGRQITAPKIVIATGARPLVPPIPGLEEAGFLDNVTLLDLNEAPESLIIVGGGYIGCEYGHFFSAMGTDVTIIQRPAVLLNDEDPDVGETVTKALAKYMTVRVRHQADRVAVENGKKVVYAKDLKSGDTARFEADEILLALGRRSNADLLKPEKAGVETDSKGWIKVNQYLETSVPGIWALGDATGKDMFRHAANFQSGVVSHNMFHGHKREYDNRALPHAVYTCPQVGHVGMTLADARARGLKVMVGKAMYSGTAKGVAMAEETGFVKVVVARLTNKILGCTIVGPDAAALVQQVVYLMNCGTGDMSPLYKSMVIHPAISEVVMNAFAALENVD
ncbi:MAG: Dihydrolipoyl dehydrogenase [Methanocella sp. PtaU1.Bin125]|nr:MAG: Dihydrolipoyl dehydrogenase [Methanocella sp. PtaU1.Bin125]